MDDLFKNFWNKNECKRNGICALNPVSRALDAVIINEIRQAAFYIIKLKEINLINMDIMKEAVFYLSVNIIDTDFDKNTLRNFFKKIKEIKQTVKDYYMKKASETGISYEFITPVFEENSDNQNINELIKNGENVIKQFYNSNKTYSLRLANLIIALCKNAAFSLVQLSKYKDADIKYYYEILRLLSLTNYSGTRKEKLIRRTKEFSEILYKIKNELNEEIEKKFGKPLSGKISTKIYQGNSILIAGFDLDELYNLLEKTKDENINIYLTHSLVNAFLYPKFQEYEHLKGIFGTGDIEYDFSQFKGAIYVTEHSNISLDSIIRGSVFTTRAICSTKSRQITKNNLSPLIEEAKKINGYEQDIEGNEARFEYSLEDSFKENKVLISEGMIKNKKFDDYKIIVFPFPNDSSFIYEALKKFEEKEISFRFANCSLETIGIIGSILHKNISEIYIENCPISNINPHATEALIVDFNVKTEFD